MKWSIENYVWRKFFSRGKVGADCTEQVFRRFRSLADGIKHLTHLNDDCVSVVGEKKSQHTSTTDGWRQDGAEIPQLWMRFINDNKQSLKQISFCT